MYMPPKKRKVKVKKPKASVKQKQKQTQYVTVNVAGAQEKPKAKRKPRKKKDAVTPFNAPRAGGGGGGGLSPLQEFRQVVFAPQDRSGDSEVRSTISSLNQKISSLFNRQLGSEAPMSQTGPAVGEKSFSGSQAQSDFTRTASASRAGSSPPVKPVVQRRGSSRESGSLNEEQQISDRLGRAGLLRTAQSKPFHQPLPKVEPTGVDSESMGVARTERQKPMYAPYTTEPEKRRVKDAMTLEERDVLEEEKVRKGGGRGPGKKTVKKNELDRLLEAESRERLRQMDLQAAADNTAHFGQASGPFEETQFI